MRRLFAALLQGEPQLRIELGVRLQQLVGMPQAIPIRKRTVRQLLAEAEQERKEEERGREREAERKHLAELEALAQREDAAWQEIELLLRKYTAQNYQQAVDLVSRLRGVAVHRKTETVFQERLNSIYERYPTRHSLLKRLRAAGLDSTENAAR